MNSFENYVYEPVDLCACYEPMVEAPQEFIDEWQAARDAEIKELKEPDGVPAFYAANEYETLYFYYGNTRIRVAEHFNDSGKPIGTLIEDVIRYSAAHRPEKTTEN